MTIKKIANAMCATKNTSYRYFRIGYREKVQRKHIAVVLCQVRSAEDTGASLEKKHQNSTPPISLEPVSAVFCFTAVCIFSAYERSEAQHTILTKKCLNRISNAVNNGLHSCHSCSPPMKKVERGEAPFDQPQEHSVPHSKGP